jgi:hypothetical protein
MSNRSRLLITGGVAVVALSGAAGYLLNTRSPQHHPEAATPAASQASAAVIGSGPRIVFRNTALGPSYGQVAMVSLANPAGPRALVSASCDRIYATASEALCLSSDRGVTTTYQAQVLGTDFTPIRTLPLAGAPSRARLSRDGSLAATTSFTAGDSYERTGFSTRTVITSLDPTKHGGDLEDFTLIQNGKTVKPVDRNIWGVTFAKDDNTFYATVAFGSKTHLVRGDLAGRTLTILHTDAECPSLSPDGTTLVYKKRSGQPVGKWRLASYDISTGKETFLAETRSVDDQVEWLDNHTVVYGLPRTGSQAATDDVWAVPSDGSGTPHVLIPQAWSPAVVQ